MKVSESMKPVLYIESSVVSYLAARRSADLIVAARQSITHDWWENQRHRFELRISTLVEEEISEGDRMAAERRLSWVSEIPSLSITDEAKAIARLLISRGSVPVGSEEDALHIGIAASQGAEYLLTWNFRHINNAETKDAIVSIIRENGYECPRLCSPEELGGMNDVTRPDC